VRRHPVRSWISGPILLGLLMAGCVTTGPIASDPPRPPSSAGAASGSFEPSPTPSSEPSIDLAGLDEATRTAIEIRASYGLRRDLDWIRHVAADPTATTEFGTPLLPSETEELFARSTRADRIVPIVQSYAADHVAVFGGLWLDQASGGVVTVSFTDDLEPHRAALAALLAGKGIVHVVTARYSESTLRALQDRIVADDAWFHTIPARLTGVGADVMRSVVTVGVSTANPAIADLIAARFGVPPDVLDVQSDGTGAVMMPFGELHGRIEDVPPKTFGELFIISRLIDGPVGVRCEIGGDVGTGPDAQGRFTLPCQQGTWEIQAARSLDDIVATGRVVMSNGGSANVVLRPVAP
jgi:hypothetical protein